MGGKSFKSKKKKEKRKPGGGQGENKVAKKNWDQGWKSVEKGQTIKVNLGWHMDKKQNPINAPSIHVGVLVGAASLWSW